MGKVLSPGDNIQGSAAPGDAAAQSWAAPHQTGLSLVVWDSTGTPGTDDPMPLLLQLLDAAVDQGWRDSLCPPAALVWSVF